MSSMGDWMREAMERECEQMVAGMVGLCPWMDGQDVAVLREVGAAHIGLVLGDDVDLGVMAGGLMVLTERAEVAGDWRRQWAFEHWYAWACAASRGEEYQWPDLPEELAVLL